MPEEEIIQTPNVTNKEKRDKKSIIFTAGLGIVVGILLSLLFWYLRTASPEPVPSGTSQSTPNELVLALSNPEDGTTVNKDIITVSGKTGVPAIVVVNGGAEDIILEKTDGTFSTEYKLLEGENEVTVTVFDETGNEKTETRNILYLNEQID
ncbi:MAG: hypothetical protein A2134_02100 [Candidatus Woykebacteria bacterium RBG_16_39_9b]|uniref:Bacterial Ig-like domain-containing protein n=1 Tax=Candidatus Woykebacteria bacterium RBG_16_39_9b TaxID=1802595 RepID=A0A1G1WC25_9BACT|nr:MAG: hypothetical protein A2134_02100 [Candidatus Woykebacteria bacterium RBG_16_39_9b]